MRTRSQNLFILGAGIILILAGTYSFIEPKTEPESEPLGIITPSDTPASEGSPLLPQKLAKPAINTTPLVPVEKITEAKTPLDSEQQAFQTFLDASYLTLVQSKELKKARAEHDTPSETYRDSEAFGRIMDDVKANPALVPLAMDFYERCALNPSVIAPTRSVCLAHLKYWSGKKQIPFNPTRFPSEILSTAERLPVQWD